MQVEGGKKGSVVVLVHNSWSETRLVEAVRLLFVFCF